MTTEPKVNDAPWMIEGDSLHLLGKPENCSGFIGLRNPSESKVRIRKISLAAPLKGPKEVAIPGLQVFARLQPGSSGQFEVQMQLPPQTPPGKYSSELLTGKARTPITVEVMESWELSIIPHEISLKVRPGERPVRRVQISNIGNMPWKVQKALFVPLAEEDGLHRNIFQSLKNSPEGNYENVLNDFARRMKETEVEPAQIRLKSDYEALGPGETREFEIEIVPPDGLKKHRRYKGSGRFENARLRIMIESLENHIASTKEIK